MYKVDKTVLKETGFILTSVVIMSLLLQSVFLILSRWDYTVLLGNLLSGAVAVLNFFLMGITVSKAVLKEEKEAKNLMKLSQLYRTLMLFVVIVIGVLLPCFNVWAVIIPLFFVRIAIALRPVIDRKKGV